MLSIGSAQRPANKRGNFLQGQDLALALFTICGTRSPNSVTGFGDPISPARMASSSASLMALRM